MRRAGGVRRREQAKASGRCVSCRRIAEFGRAQCVACLTKYRTGTVKKKAVRAGYCGRCRRNRAAPDRSKCQRCLDVINTSIRKLVARRWLARRCGACMEPVSRYKRCGRCRGRLRREKPGATVSSRAELEVSVSSQQPKSEYDRDGDLRPGEHVAVHRIISMSGATLARPGSRCGAVPRCDLAWLLEDGHIKLKGDRDTWQNKSSR